MARDKGSAHTRRHAAPAEEVPGHAVEAEPGHWLSRNLRRIYDETLQEPIPENLRTLLEELERRDKPKG
jgi:hypothetical protein